MFCSIKKANFNLRPRRYFTSGHECHNQHRDFWAETLKWGELEVNQNIENLSEFWKKFNEKSNSSANRRLYDFVFKFKNDLQNSG